MTKQPWEQWSELFESHTPAVQLDREWFAFSQGQKVLEHSTESLNTKRIPWNNPHKWIIFLNFCENSAGMHLEGNRFLSFSKAHDVYGTLWKRELQECRKSCSPSHILSSIHGIKTLTRVRSNKRSHMLFCLKDLEIKNLWKTILKIKLRTN